MARGCANNASAGPKPRQEAAVLAFASRRCVKRLPALGRAGSCWEANVRGGKRGTEGARGHGYYRMNWLITPCSRRDMQKSAIEEIKELKARLESMAEHAKAEALAAANEAIGVLRDLGIDNDAILKELGFRGQAKDQESRVKRPPKDEPCPVCNFKTDPPHNGRSHRGQAKKWPFTDEELEEKGLTKV
jgi:hypothetical protein